MSIPYTTYSQLPLFTATTVHSYTEHNTPHQRLIDNDNNLQTQVNDLSTAISNIKAIVQMGTSTYIPSPALTANQTNDAVSGWTISKQLSDVQSRLVVHLDIQWYGGARAHDQWSSTVQMFLRATGQAVTPGDQGLAMFGALYGGMGEDWADIITSNSLSCLRIIRANAGSVPIGYRVVFSSGHPWYPTNVNRLTMTYFELALS